MRGSLERLRGRGVSCGHRCLERVMRNKEGLLERLRAWGGMWAQESGKSNEEGQ